MYAKHPSLLRASNKSTYSRVLCFGCNYRMPHQDRELNNSLLLLIFNTFSIKPLSYIFLPFKGISNKNQELHLTPPGRGRMKMGSQHSHRNLWIRHWRCFVKCKAKIRPPSYLRQVGQGCKRSRVQVDLSENQTIAGSLINFTNQTTDDCLISLRAVWGTLRWDETQDDIWGTRNVTRSKVTSGGLFVEYNSD